MRELIAEPAAREAKLTANDLRRITYETPLPMPIVIGSAADMGGAHIVGEVRVLDVRNGGLHGSIHVFEGPFYPQCIIEMECTRPHRLLSVHVVEVTP